MGFELDGGELPVTDGNWSVLMAFNEVSDQWRSGAAGIIGLDNPAVIATLKALGVPKWKAKFKGIKVMAREILKVWSEERERATRK